MSSRSVPTTLIGPKGLLRDSLASLLAGYSYRVTDSFQTAAAMPGPAGDEGQRLVLLVLRTMEAAIAEAEAVRRICSDCRIVALLEQLPGADIRKLAGSAVDGCIPLHVSQDVLTGTLDLVMADGTRIVVLSDDPRLNSTAGEDRRGAGSSGETGGDAASAARAADPDRDESTLAAGATGGVGMIPADRKACAGSRALAVSRPGLPSVRPILSLGGMDVSPVGETGPGNTRRLNRHIAARFDRRGAGADEFDAPVPALSERERQIIDGLVKGQPNKTIARVCGITEATVKVHMKAILRKVPCSNRTQVAIWALDHPHLFRPVADAPRLEAPPGMAE